MKEAIFLIECDSYDGKGPSTIVYAGHYEADRDEFFEKIHAGNKPWHRKTEKVVDLKEIQEKAFKKLDALEKYAIIYNAVLWSMENEKTKLA